MGYEFEALSGRIIEAAIAVHKALGPGFLETIYENALRVALNHRQIPYESQKEVAVAFEGLLMNFNSPTLIVKRIVL